MRRLWLLFSQAVTVALALLFVVATLKPEWLGGRRGALPLPTPSLTLVAPSPIAGTASGNGLAWPGFRAAAQLAAPAVVSIVASQAARPNPHRDDPRFRFFFGDPSPQPRVGLGSGVIVAPEGYLLTNHHVVDGADEIEVQLVDGRAAAAELVGSDPETDLAVLKIELDALPVATFGDQGALHVGDLVLAIGNPFNVGQTVTSGIVSALGRTGLQLSTYENFIQTDAAINPGNSGGALVDAAGHLVGINTAIFSRGGGSLGIGFAIPADTARQVLDALVRDGRVRRGWLGVEQQDLTPEFARSFGVSASRGVVVTGVLRDGPASRGGLRPGDVIVAVGDTPVANRSQLLTAVAALAPGATSTLSVQRGSEALTLEVTVGERPAPGERPR
jgi:Do/DeqQ family serine protease